MKVLIEYQNGEKRTSMELDMNETVEFLRYQLYSLTNIAPKDQHIIGINSNITVNDSMLIKALQLADGQRLIVKTRLTADSPAPAPSSSSAATFSPATSVPAAAASRPQAAATPMTSNVAVAAIARELQECCSRAYFGKEKIPQPSAFFDDKPICYACAMTCVAHMPEKRKPRLSGAPFSCACAELGGSHECLFSARSLNASDLLTGAPAQQVKAALEQLLSHTLDAQMAQGKQQMQARIHSYIQGVLLYEQPDWQAKAREVLPLAELNSRVEKARAEPESTTGPRDEFMNQMLHWFKHEFFTWVNAPPCDTCGQGTSGIGGARPTPQEAVYMPGVVEVYKCEAGHITRFPRYNHAAKLLETRRGRCGEWAQAFMLFCRAMNYEARLAHDFTDHVWIEYYSEESKRWIHCDPCENRRGTPMLYEGGWGKKLTYVIGVSKDEVVDVTKRYSKKWTQVLERRTMCPENWLSNYLVALTQIKYASLPQARQAEFFARRNVENAEFEANVQEEAHAEAEKLKEEERQGRTTGSVEWRAARGELGSDATAIQRALHPELTEASSKSSSSSSSSSVAVATPIVPTPESKKLCSTDPSSQTNTTNDCQPPATAAVDSAAQAKAKIAALFKQYLTQVTTGCGSSNCTTEKCKSNSKFDSPKPAEAAKFALELTKQGASQLCANMK